jgi:hypothetical protein
MAGARVSKEVRPERKERTTVGLNYVSQDLDLETSAATSDGKLMILIRWI